MKVSQNRQPQTNSGERTLPVGRQQKLARLRQTLVTMFSGRPRQTARRGQLLLEQLESRQMLAGDIDLLFTSGTIDSSPSSDEAAVLASTTTPEGEAAQDLVAFAKALSDAGVTYYGAAWCPACTEQRQLFADGGQFLPFVEVTNSDRSLNEIGQAAGIEAFPTWEFPDGSRETGVLSLDQISQLSGVDIPQSSSPSFVPVGDTSVAITSPLHIPIDAYNPAGGPITITVEVDDPSLLEATVLSGNRSIRMSVEGYGDMVFELFEQRAPRPAGRVIELADSGFYDGTIFHRIIDNFVIQGGDPTGTGTGGSELGPFDDQYHPDLQHNRTGVLSFAKAGDDTNNSQFFITEGPQRTLDFNHSVFGQLVEGEHVRSAISDIANLQDKGTDEADRPQIDIVLDSVTVFEDDQNAVILLKAIGEQSGSTNVTITATNAQGESFSEVINVSVVPDSGVGSNSPPFLEDIDPLPDFPNDAPATLQLSSIDVEGDPVEYLIDPPSGENFTAAVDGDGLVTVTPAEGFVGTVDVTVGVRPAPGVEGALPGQQDTQRLSLNFIEHLTLDAPTAVRLDPASDTGASDSDRITNAGSLTFHVDGVLDGAHVSLFAGSIEIGEGIAEGDTATITTNNIAGLGDGTYEITARQRVDEQTSSVSPPLSITYDSTPPVRVQNFPILANVGIPLDVELNHPEEGEGLVYAFAAAPPTASIDPESGAINWTPGEDQIGDQQFTLALTDLAGNTREETFVVTVGDVPLAGVRLEVADLDGNPIAQINPDEEFLLKFFAQDLRGPFDLAGVFAAFTDIRFDSNLVGPAGSDPIQFSSNYGSIISSGSFGTGIIDELGAVANSLAPTDSEEDLVARVRMQAIGQGLVTFVSEPADVEGNDFLLFNEDAAIPPERIAFGRAELLIGPRFTAVDDSFTVPQDSEPTLLDVLDNDSFAPDVTGTLTLSDVTTPSDGGTATIQDNQVLYQPAPGFVGSETFQYDVTDDSGATQSATVTVTVTSEEADSPTAVDDQFTVTSGAPLATFDVLANDSPASSESTITITDVSSSEQGSTVEIAGDGTAIGYAPATDFVGSETITYTITDSGGGTATASVTFNVVDSAPTRFRLSVDTGGRSVKFGGNLVATLTGTTAGGDPVSNTLSLNDHGEPIEFDDLPAGDYQVEIPAVPFLLGMQQPQRLSFTAGEQGGEMSGTVQVGSLHPNFMRLEDFFSSSANDVLFAVVTPGDEAMLVLGQDRLTNLVVPQVRLSEDGTTVTVREDAADGDGTEQTLNAEDGQYRQRAENGPLRLVRINLAGLVFNEEVQQATTQTNAAPDGGNVPLQDPIDISQLMDAQGLMEAPGPGEGEAAGSVSLPSTNSAPRTAPPVASTSPPADNLFADNSDPLSLGAIQVDTLNDDEEDGLSPEAVDALLGALG